MQFKCTSWSWAIINQRLSPVAGAHVLESRCQILCRTTNACVWWTWPWSFLHASIGDLCDEIDMQRSKCGRILSYMNIYNCIIITQVVLCFYYVARICFCYFPNDETNQFIEKLTNIDCDYYDLCSIFVTIILFIILMCCACFMYSCTKIDVWAHHFDSLDRTTTTHHYLALLLLLLSLMH